MATSTKTKSILSSLSLTEQHKRHSRDPIVQRQQKLIDRILVQKEMAQCLIENQEFTAYKYVTKVDDATGVKQKVRVPKKIKPWHYQVNGEWFTTIKYGAKPLELSNGLFAVAVGDKSSLASVYDTVIEAIKAGELNEQLAAITAVGKK